jgi:hypothetical protein
MDNEHIIWHLAQRKRIFAWETEFTGMAFGGCGLDIVVLLFWHLICLYKGSQLPYYFTLSSMVFIFNLGDPWMIRLIVYYCIV